MFELLITKEEIKIALFEMAPYKGVFPLSEDVGHGRTYLSEFVPNFLDSGSLPSKVNDTLDTDTESEPPRNTGRYEAR